MIEQLFGSKTRVKLLQLFYQNPNRSYYVREITRKIDEQINSVRRELANLLSIGIITSDTTNNKLYYEVNQKFEHYDALASVFGGKSYKPSKAKKAIKNTEADEVAKAEVEEKVAAPEPATQDPFVEQLIKTGNIELAIYTGQFTRDDTAGVDIVVVGDVNHASLDKLIAELEEAEKKELRYSVFTPDEYNYRKQVNDRFISNVLISKKIVLIDKTK
jgi:hypothetical protein